ncbi:CAIB/BAIF family protein [plant metagenome]|uniref:CAIB/BAIF family protein n=1 Tax=plant metagenome TaxID=1297885 RepID=A0A484Q2B5_9ZZZZ
MVMGPLVGQILADLGADLIKVEPLAGDDARRAYPSREGMGALFANNNRNKRSIAIDLKHPDGQKVLRELISRSDVFLHNMRADAAERLGAGFAAATAVNPKLVYCAATGFGQAGRYRDRPAYDDVVQAAGGMAGLMQLAGGDAPRFAPTILADKVGALHAVYGILAALFARERGHTTPIQVEVPMFESLAAFLLNEHLAEATFETGGKVGYPRVLSPDRRPHRTADGWITVLPYTTEQWRRFLTEIGRSDVTELPWFSRPEQRSVHIDTLYGIASEALKGRDTETWIERLTALDIPCSRVAQLQDLLTDPHLQDIGFFAPGDAYPAHLRRVLPQPVKFGHIAAETDRPPPALGSHTREILAECGLEASKIDEMLQHNVVHQSSVADDRTDQGDNQFEHIARHA